MYQVISEQEGRGAEEGESAEAERGAYMGCVGMSQDESKSQNESPNESQNVSHLEDLPVSHLFWAVSHCLSPVKQCGTVAKRM